MFHRATELKFGSGTELRISFETGEIKRYDVSQLFVKYPQMEALKDRNVFTSGKLFGGYGIIWNDDLDLEAETVYEDGITIGHSSIPCLTDLAKAIREARAEKEMSQKDLAEVCGINQADISRIERGTANPSVRTLQRIAIGLGLTLRIELSSH